MKSDETRRELIRADTKMEKPRGRLWGQPCPPPGPSFPPGLATGPGCCCCKWTSVPMETAEVGEGSRSQLVSLKGAGQARDPDG